MEARLGLGLSRRRLLLGASALALASACQKVEYPTALVPAAAQTARPTEIPFRQVGDFVINFHNPNKLEFFFCTQGRPDAKIRFSYNVKRILIPGEKLDEEDWRVVEEIDAPCVPTREASPRRVIWDYYSHITQVGDYRLQAEALPPEAGGDWKSNSVLRDFVDLKLRTEPQTLRRLLLV